MEPEPSWSACQGTAGQGLSGLDFHQDDEEEEEEEAGESGYGRLDEGEPRDGEGEEVAVGLKLLLDDDYDEEEDAHHEQ